MYMKKYILLFCIVFSPLLVVAQEAQHILKLWQGNTFVEYNIDTSAGHPTDEGDDIVRYSLETKRV